MLRSIKFRCKPTTGGGTEPGWVELLAGETVETKAVDADGLGIDVAVIQKFTGSRRRTYQNVADLHS